jgi:hypothetical protein
MSLRSCDEDVGVEVIETHADRRPAVLLEDLEIEAATA